MNTRIPCFLAILSLALAVPAYAHHTQSGPKDSTVLIIRHGEKPKDPSDRGLSKAGQARAQAYVHYFETKRIGWTSIKPDALVATAASKHSDRPRLTIQPLANNLGLGKCINLKYADADIDGLVQALDAGSYDRKNVLIAWHHGKIGTLMKHLGANSDKLLGAKKWPGDVFGWLVILHFNKDGTLDSSRVINEQLMPDDTINPPSSR